MLAMRFGRLRGTVVTWGSVRYVAIAIVVGSWLAAADAEGPSRRFQLRDIFELEYVSDPQISPDGKQVAYVRNFMDVMQDRPRANIWLINSDGTDNRPLTAGNRNDGSPRWSPDSKRLIYTSKSEDDSVQIFCRWLDTQTTSQLTHLTSGPSDLAWSPDGRWVAFSMAVPEPVEPLPSMPARPEGAKWADPPRVIRRVLYRRDGAGYQKDEYRQLHILPAEGGTPRQLTRGPYQHEGRISWAPDGSALVFSGNRDPDWEYQPRESEVYELALAGGAVRTLTARKGPDQSPIVSPDGGRIAYVGYDDRKLGHQDSRLYVMNRDGTNARLISEKLNRDVQNPVWNQDGTGIYAQCDERGSTRIAFFDLVAGTHRDVAFDLGGVTLDRPYASGTFSVAQDGAIAYTTTSSDFPAELTVGRPGARSRRLTAVNEDLLEQRDLAEIEELVYDSSHDGRKIHGWIMKPPGFDPRKKYPLLLEIHGGPFANYGDRFAIEMQLFAAAGYVVLFVNPRGSTSYGEEFANLIHHDYPGHDYDDLMSGVDAVIARGYVDVDNLFVTGGSGGGILTAWIVGKTDRFRAAVAAKPVINWYSHVLTADIYPFFNDYWFPGFPWENAEHYLKRSPLSLVGNVKTPTMLITGEQDYRTPISESEQFYQALKLRRVESALVRIPGAPHSMFERPTHEIAKVAHILEWFAAHRRSP